MIYKSKYRKGGLIPFIEGLKREGFTFKASLGTSDRPIVVWHRVRVIAAQAAQAAQSALIGDTVTIDTHTRIIIWRVIDL